MKRAAIRGELRQERDVVAYETIAAAFVVVLVVSAILLVWAFVGLRSAERRDRPGGEFPERETHPRRAMDGIEQSIFAGEMGEGERNVRRQRQRLETYGWVDERRRIVRIPIDVAIDRVVEESQP